MRMRSFFEERAVDLVLLVLGVVIVGPFIWMALSSLKTAQEIAAQPLVWLPHIPQWANFSYAISKLNFGQLFVNSLLVSTVNATAVVLTSALSGYALAKFAFPGRGLIFMLALSTMMVPFFIKLIPVYYIVKTLGWVNSYLGLMVPHFVTGFGIFLMRQAAISVPDSLLDAARIDGCSEFRIFWQIVLPLVKPSLATLAVFSFMYHWDDFLWPMIIISKENLMTIPIGLNRLWNPSSIIDYNLMMAGATLAVIPVLIAFIVAQKYFVRGVMMSGIKG